MNDFTNSQGDLAGMPNVNKHKGSRAEFLKHIRSFPAHIVSAIKGSKLRLADQLIYSIKPVGNSKTIKLFETQDQKQTGLRNLSNAKLPKNQAMVISGVYILAGVAPAQTQGSPTYEEICATPFRSLDTTQFSAIANGELTIKSNKRTIVPESSLRLWCTPEFSPNPVGFYEIDNSRPILDEELIEATIELGSTVNIPADTMIYMGLFGTATTP